MENKFSEIMVGKSTEELEKIITMKDDYQSEAVQAAELELANRISIQENEGVKLEDGDDYLFLKEIKSLSDSDLILFYNKNYLSLKSHETPILNTELKNRNIEPKVWYYSKGNEKKGPYSASELKDFARKGEIDFYDFVWCNGLRNWVEAKDVKGLFELTSFPSRIGNKIPDFISRKKVNAGIILSAITLFVIAIGWLLYGVAQVGLSNGTVASEMGRLGVWNILFSLVCVGFGIGVLMMKKWGYDWGLGTASINALWFGYVVFFESISIFDVLMFLLCLIAAVLLYVNRKVFEESVEVISI